MFGFLGTFGIALALSQTLTGTLKGHVDIGPLSPVQKIGVKETPSPAMYKGYEIHVKAAPENAKMLTKVYKRVEIDKHGDFTTTLSPGRYRVEVSQANTARRGFMHPFPGQYITVVAGKTVTTKLFIDTGIR